MTKPHFRIVTLLLVPALLLDTGTDVAMAHRSPPAVPAIVSVGFEEQAVVQPTFTNEADPAARIRAIESIVPALPAPTAATSGILQARISKYPLDNEIARWIDF